MASIRTHVRRAVNPAGTYSCLIVTLREFEDRDRPRRAVVGTPDDVAPPEWGTGPVTGRQRAAHAAKGAHLVIGLLLKLGAAIVAAVRGVSS